ncbi:carbamate kinase [Candidatus Bipolaricaulota bacterium]|nr:carbamate kinase [Candidatus Bipolaricaulota bacterium]
MESNEKTLTVVALGGNAILKPGQEGTAEEQIENVNETTKQLAEMVLSGEYKIVLSHGNGPQVGNILLQNEIAKDEVPSQPLDVCGAESQGLIGYMFAQSLDNVFNKNGRGDIPVSTVLTQTLVEADDPAFEDPSKPVGPFYSKEKAERLEEEKNYDMIEDAGRGYRRVVPSPKPKEIIEKEPIVQLVSAGTVVIASGGGGIPVVKEDNALVGREAVIDKDLATEQLAEDVGAEVLVILTDVEFAYLNYNQPDEEALGGVTVDEAEAYLEEGHFARGSMKPKIEAGTEFVRQGGEKAVITSLEKALEALDGNTGTIITSE